MDEKQWQTMEGTVERVVFRNEDNGWTVLDVAAGEELHKVVGVLPMASVGERLKLAGEWVEHPNFGTQFRAEYAERALPEEVDGILRYLSSGAVKGIGAATAAKIVEKFGTETLRIMEREPIRLTEVKGITPARAKAMGDDFAAQFGLREVMLTFSQYGLTANEALRCWKRWGGETIGKIRENPYLLCSSGLYIGFERADQICMGMNGAADDVRRIEAGLLYVLRHNTGNGHTCLPDGKLLPTTAELLGIDLVPVAEALEGMVAGLAVKTAEIGGRRFVFLPHLYQAENYIAARVVTLAALPPAERQEADREIDLLESCYGIRYERKQRQAIREALERGALILTGGPGTGKTTTLKAIIGLFEKRGLHVSVAAPTGRAAKRIGELTGCEAKTLHRLLEVQWSDEDTPVFARNETNPLDTDVLVIDEMSMVDTQLFEHTLRALKADCRLILVGDTDQLPAVGAGCVLQDLIDSGILPVVQLTEVFRQAMESHIIRNAHRIVRGELPELGFREGDFFFLQKNSVQSVADTLLDLCARRLPNRYEVSVWNGLQVLCPGRKGPLGTRELNRGLQELLNPPGPDKPEITVEGVLLRKGDKVMHTRNNYDIGWTKEDGEFGSGVFNGDIGILEEIDRRGDALSVRYDDRVALYTKQEAQDLELAYAVTVHKSQGSEFEAVVMPVFQHAPQLSYRNLLYTAVTRAKSLLVLVGSPASVREMVENDRKTLRYSGLGTFIGQAAEKLL